MADFYTYRNEVASKRRKRKMFLVLIVILALLCAGAGFFWFKNSGTPAPAASAEPVAATPETAPTATEAPTATPAAIAEPQRIVQAVDTAVWDKSDAVEQTIDTEYLNTDHRMVAVPMLGTVTKDYFNTVTFAGDSIASGLGIYSTGYNNAHYATYVSAGVQTFVNNVSVKNAVTGTTETPLETIVSSQPDYLYILVGTNNLVVQGSENSLTPASSSISSPSPACRRMSWHPSPAWTTPALPPSMTCWPIWRCARAATTSTSARR